MFNVVHSSWGSISENGTATGAMEMVVNRQAHLTLGMYTITFLRSQFMTSSEFYYTSPFILVIPPGRPFTAFEKLFRPFTTLVWILLIATFTAAVAVITIIKLRRNSELVRNFVLGAGNRTPYLNILISSVGGSMTVLPRNNFARSLLMMFLLFLIVQRTLYQAALFQFMQRDDRKRELQTIDELVERNFKVFMLVSSLEHTEHMKFRSQRVVIKSATEQEKHLVATVDPSFKGAVTWSVERVAYFNKVNSKNLTLTVCKEFLFTFQYGIYFQKKSYLAKVFNEKLSLMKAAGLIDFWASDYIKMEFLRPPQGTSSPKKLNLSQMLGGFQILLVGYAIGVVAFVCELSSIRIVIMRPLAALINFLS